MKKQSYLLRIIVKLLKNSISSGIFSLALLIVLFSFGSCQSKKTPKVVQPAPPTMVRLETNKGSIVLKLYNETPKHRDNFISLIEEGVYDSLLFHRVIENFMIQGGDPDSKLASDSAILGNGGLDYRVFPEFHPELFHKKGVLAAARDGNPDRASSSTQFYIVQGAIQNDSTLALAEKRINNWIAFNLAQNDSTNKELSEALNDAMRNENEELYTKLYDSLNAIAEDYGDDHYSIPNKHREVYKTIGGTPHLDQNYTVFGEVVQGLHVVDSIAAVETNKFDRPVENVRILSSYILSETNTKK